MKLQHFAIPGFSLLDFMALSRRFLVRMAIILSIVHAELLKRTGKGVKISATLRLLAPTLLVTRHVVEQNVACEA
eukprot:450206-Amphidinium_carterae.1